MDEPLGEMTASAVHLHESFVSYMRAGFTRAEALHLISTLLIAAAIQPRQ